MENPHRCQMFILSPSESTKKSLHIALMQITKMDHKTKVLGFFLIADLSLEENVFMKRLMFQPHVHNFVICMEENTPISTFICSTKRMLLLGYIGTILMQFFK